MKKLAKTIALALILVMVFSLASLAVANYTFYLARSDVQVSSVRYHGESGASYTTHRSGPGKIRTQLITHNTHVSLIALDTRSVDLSSSTVSLYSLSKFKNKWYSIYMRNLTQNGAVGDTVLGIF